MARTATEAVRAALAQTTNAPGMCQAVTRAWLGAPSVGDVDGDGRADAEDGWKSEPQTARHTDRRPPAGAPVSWSGGGKDDGHRALSLGPIGGTYMIRTTDGDGEGRVATRPLDWPERTWGLTYLGWSDTISGQPIPGLVANVTPPTPPKKSSRGWRVERALKLLESQARHTKSRTQRAAYLAVVQAVRRLPLIK